MRAHLVQMDIVWEDRGANYDQVERLLGGDEDGGVGPGDLVVLPELFDVGFSLNLDAAVDAAGETLAFLRRLAERSGATVHGGRAVMSPDGEKALNLAVAVGPDGAVLAEYAKVHPFSYGREGERYNGGYAIGGYEWVGDGERLRVCPAVCYDLRFPELFRIGARRGAEAFVIGANWPAARQMHWRTLLIARAIENQAFVLGVNRCGDDPHLAYAGGTICVSPKGEVIGELGDEPGVLTVEVDPAAVRAWRAEFPALRDVRLV
ncbi:MAG: hypothetical protein LAT64_06920 [Phycisphaerales bacterium]|nr:carbon-nitrogen family hydrolase [Planctomycetota bacterium]MCH8508486.1 hypothetical protein [Phycisphaerales bacterium]